MEPTERVDEGWRPEPRGPRACTERTEDPGELTLEAPLAGSPGTPPAPTWSPPAFALAAWGGAWLASATLGVPAAALAGAVAGAALARRAGGWPSGGLLTAASWTIGGIGAGTVAFPVASPAAAAFWDAGLVALALAAVAARGPADGPAAWWRRPAQVLAVLGGAQLAARWLG